MSLQSVVDPCETVIQIIEDGYTLGNVSNSEAPAFVNANDQKRVNVGNKPGMIRCYLVSDIPSYDNYGARKRHDRVARVGIEFEGFRTRNYMLTNVQEVQRILEVNQEAIEDFNMTGDFLNPFNRMYEVDNKDLSRSRSSSHHKYILDVELWVVGYVRATS